MSGDFLTLAVSGVHTLSPCIPGRSVDVPGRDGGASISLNGQVSRFPGALSKVPDRA